MGHNPNGAGGSLAAQAREAVRGTLAEANEAAALAWRSPDGRSDRRLLSIVLVAALCLYLQHYLVIQGVSGLPAFLFALGAEQTARDLYAAFTEPVDGPFVRQVFWALGVSVCLFVLPAFALWLSGARLGDFGLSLGRRSERWIYVLLLLVMAPLVLLAATQPGFQGYYPFYRPPPGEPLWPRFAIFECVYLLQFVAVEFFFRGFLLHGARHRFGGFTILLPLIPYMMVHFGKPPAEAAGAVAAGLVLGFLSLRTGSILYGVVLHAGVALTMDISSLAMQGRMF